MSAYLDADEATKAAMRKEWNEQNERRYQCMAIADEVIPLTEDERETLRKYGPWGKPNEKGYVTIDRPLSPIQKQRCELAMQIHDFITGND